MSKSNNSKRPDSKSDAKIKDNPRSSTRGPTRITATITLGRDQARIVSEMAALSGRSVDDVLSWHLSGVTADGLISDAAAICADKSRAGRAQFMKRLQKIDHRFSAAELREIASDGFAARFTQFEETLAEGRGANR